MISLQAVAKNIRDARLIRNYSQDYLGRRLGISQNAYSKIELGKTEITITRLGLLAEVLDYDALDFIRVANRFSSMSLASRSA